MDYPKYIIDIEANGLLHEATKIHCLGYCNTKTGLVCSTSYQDQIRDFFLQEDVYFIAHNGITYDFPLIEKIYRIKIKAKKIDTLALSWTLNSERNDHKLGTYGEEFGIAKPKIEDWENLSIQEYIHRVEEDVKINYQLWVRQAKYLNQLYEGNHEQIYKYLEYLTFKLECVSEAESLGVKLDMDLCNKSLLELEAIKEEKIKALTLGMPKKAIKAVKFPPKIMFKADGTPSLNRLKWLEFLKENNLPENHNTEVEFIHSYEEPNPNSHDQIKDWLYNIGWVPEHIKHVRDKKKGGEVRKIPQIKSKDDDDGSICPSIVKLIEKEPVLENLDSLFILSHRINLFKGFLRDQKNGRLYQGTYNFTNTLRLTHAGIVNLPNSFKKYSENIRACLIPDEGKIMMGCDLSGLEDNTKRHYIYQYDPEYVKEMSIEGYDPHLELAILGGLLTQEQADNHKKGIENHKETRHKAKQGNFALTYKTGIDTLMRTVGLGRKECEKLKNAYWKRNKAILDVENSLRVKDLQGQKWLLNPVSGFWYSLRAEKDRFSTLNQGTAVYVFDRWLYYIRNQGIKVNFQIHDEFTTNLFEDYKESYTNKVNNAIKSINEELKLNIEIKCSIDFGNRYSECH